jgi:hypothetical protein
MSAVRHDGGMRRAALAAVLLAGLAGCGGSPDVPEQRRAGPNGLGFAADLRTADARSPLVPAGSGSWRCATRGRFQLAISDQGEVAVSIGGRLLASVSSARALVNRACDVGRPSRRAARRSARGRLGASVVECRAPAIVVVDFGGGDVTVRTRGGRLLAAAAVNPERVGVAGYWGDACAPA